MKKPQSPQTQYPTWMGLITLGLMSLVAPLIAAFVHSAWVFHSGNRFYNAEIWRLSQQPDLWSIFTWIGGFGPLGAITFLVLLPFRKRMLLRWVLWICCIILCTDLLFKAEVALK